MEEWIAAIKYQSVQQADTSSLSVRMSMIGGYKAEIIGGNLIKTPLPTHSKLSKPKNKLIISPNSHPRPINTTTIHTSDPDLFALYNTSNYITRNASSRSLTQTQNKHSNSIERAGLARFASEMGPQINTLYSEYSPQIDTNSYSDAPRPLIGSPRSSGQSDYQYGGRFDAMFNFSSSSSRTSDVDMPSLTSRNASLHTEILAPSLKGLPETQANVLKEGYCVKQSSITKKWKRLYMVLGNQGLCYYKSDMKKSLLKRIWPKEIEDVRRSNSKLTIDRDNLMELHTTGKKYFIQFDSPVELSEWIYEIRSQVGLSLVTYI